MSKKNLTIRPPSAMKL